MSPDPDSLTGSEILLIVEALDAFIPVRGNDSWMGGNRFTPAEANRYGPFEELRQRWLVRLLRIQEE